MATATQQLAIWADGFSVVYDTASQIIQAISYRNGAQAVTVTVARSGVVLRQSTVMAGQTSEVDVARFNIPLSSVAQGLPSGWALAITPA